MWLFRELVKIGRWSILGHFNLEGIQNGEKLAKETNEEQPVWQEEIWERMCPESHMEKLCQKYGRNTAVGLGNET